MAIATEIAISKIISENDHDVRMVAGGVEAAGQAEEDEGKEGAFQDGGGQANVPLGGHFHWVTRMPGKEAAMPVKIDRPGHSHFEKVTALRTKAGTAGPDRPPRPDE